MSEEPYVAVIGGMNMDIFGIPDEKVIPHGSRGRWVEHCSEPGALGSANVSDYRLWR